MLIYDDFVLEGLQYFRAYFNQNAESAVIYNVTI